MALVLCGYALLVIASAVFYQHRVFYSDSAYYLFQVVNTGSFHIEHGRYGAIPTQVLPLLAIHLGASLSVVAVLYSVSIPLLSGLWAAWVCFRKRKHALLFATVILLLQVATTRHSWFWPVSELMPGLIYTSIGFFYLQQESKRFLPTVGLTFGLALFSHPAVAPMLVALLLIQRKQLPVWLLVLLVVVCIGVFVALPRSAYEQEKMTAILHADTLRHSALWGYLKFGLIKIYLLWIPMAAYALYKKREPLFWVLSIGYTLGWILLCAASESQGNSAVLLENLMLPITAFWLLVCAYTFPIPKITTPFLVLTMALFVTYTGYLGYSTYLPQTALRRGHIQLWTEAHPQTTFFEVADENVLVANDKIMRNRLPVEYLLQAAHDQNGRLMLVVPSSYAPEPESNTIYLGNDLPQTDILHLNTAYFHPVTEVGPHVVITH